MIRKKIKFALAVIFVFALILCTYLSVHAEEAESVYDKNNALLSERYSELLELKAENSATETGRNINNYIDKYAALMNNITPEKLSEESCAALIELYYTQGIISGRVARVYYTYIDGLDDEGRAAVDRVHTGVHTSIEEIDGIQDEISKAKNAEDLKESELLAYNNGGLLARMYTAIYKERLDALVLPEDTELVREIVWGDGGAIEELKQSKKNDTSEYYDEVYSRASANVTLRRNKDNAIAELLEVYLEIYPEGSVESSSCVAEAADRINSDELLLVSQLNLEVKKAVFSLFTQASAEHGEFVGAYFAQLKLVVSNTVADADVAGNVVDLSVAFEGHGLDFAKARVKDAINKDISDKNFTSDEDMKLLVEEYCSNGGVIDLSDSVERVENEFLKACRRISLYKFYKDSVEGIVRFGGEEALTLKARENYASYDIKLRDADALEEKYLEELEEVFSEGCRELSLLVTDAEAKAYEAKHGYIINKDIEVVVLSDKEYIAAAISDMDGLGDGAQGIFEEREIPDDLAKKYKKLVKLEIEQTLGMTDGVRRGTADKLSSQIDALTVSGRANAIKRLVESAEDVLVKARAAADVISAYERISSSVEYCDFSDNDKILLQSVADGAVSAICVAFAEDEVRDNIEKLASDAIVALHRSEACARIDVAISSRADVDNSEILTDIAAIASEAKQSVGGEVDEGKIKELADKAIFDIFKKLDLYDMKAVAKQAKSDIEALDVLEEIKKSEFVFGVESILLVQSNILQNAKNDAARLAAKRDLETKVSLMVEDAEGENEAQRVAKREEEGEKLKEHYGFATEKVNKMSFLKSEERESYNSELESAFKKGVEDIAKATIPEKMTVARMMAAEVFEAIVGRAASDNDTAGAENREMSDENLSAFAKGLLDKIKALQYLSDEEKSGAEQAIEQLLDSYSSALPSLSTAEMLAESEAEAYRVLNNIGKECSFRDVNEAKNAAIITINQRKNAVYGRIDKLRFLDEDAKTKLKMEADALISHAKTEIVECVGVDSVHELRDDIIKKLDSCEEMAKRKENEACVKALSPFMIGLSIAFGVLLVAAVALMLVVKKKRGEIFARCAIPYVLLAAVMPSALAWVITALLALLDLALMGLIIYLVIRLVGGNEYRGCQDVTEAKE